MAGEVAACPGGAAGVRLEPGPLGVRLALAGVPVDALPDETCLRAGGALLSLEAAAGEASGGLVEVGSDSPPRPARVVEAGVVRTGDRVVVESVRVPLTEVLDLHPFSPAEVPEVVREYLHQARRAGFVEVRLVHGRGRGVQRQRVRQLLATLPGVAGFADAPPGRGGWGATLVWLARGADPETG